MRLTVSGDPTLTQSDEVPLRSRFCWISDNYRLATRYSMLDYDTGTAPIQHLYYLPIILAALIFDYWGGLVCAFAALVSYHLRTNICER